MLIQKILYAFSIAIISRLSEAARVSAEIKLAEFLLANYSKQARPILDAKQAIQTTFGIELVQLIKVDDRNQMLTTKIWVRQSWTNFLMKWNSSDWDGINEVQLDAEMVWVPDIVLYNNGDENFPGGTEKYKTRIMVYENGLMFWLAPATFTSTCSINIKYFPFDQQTCFFKFGSWTFDMAGINLHNDNRPMLTENYINSSEWDLVKAEKKRNVVKYTCCPNPYVDVTFHIVLLRKPLYYVFNVIAPCLVLVTTILFGFFLPPESGERISLTITILLAVAVFLQLISDALPRNSDSIPILAIFYMVVMAESAISLVTTCIVLVIHYRSSDNGAAPMPNWVRKFFLGYCARLLGIKGNTATTQAIKAVVEDQASENNDKKQVRFGGVYELNDFEFQNEMNAQQELQPGIFDGILTEILREVKYITRNMLTQHKYGELQDEWKFLAKVLDRLFFWLFLLTVILSVSCILIPVYLINH